jgi:hypothetical protein
MSEQPPRTIRETLEDWFDGQEIGVEQVAAGVLDDLARQLFDASELAECRVERDRLREALQAGHDVAASAMDAVTAFVHGNGPRGMELVPLISKAHHVADLYQAALVPLVSEGETDGR